MAGFWKRDKNKNKKDKGQSKVVLPDMPVSVANPKTGLMGAVEPLKPLVGDEEVSRRSEDDTVQLDVETKMGMRTTGTPSPREIDTPADDSEETMVLGRDATAEAPSSDDPSAGPENNLPENNAVEPTSSDEETMVLGRAPSAPVAPTTPIEPSVSDNDSPPMAEPEAEPETAATGQASDEEITKPDTVIRPSRSINEEPLSRAQTLGPKVMADADKYADILPVGDDDEDPAPDPMVDAHPAADPAQDVDADADEDAAEGADADTEDAVEADPDVEKDGALDKEVGVEVDDAEDITPVSAVRKSGTQAEGEEEATRIFGARRKMQKPVAPLLDVKVAGASKQTDPNEAMADPIVGWLVIVDGPGMGNCLPLGYGTNPVGRAPELRVALTFGDSQVSRGTHATVIYDPRGRDFYVQHGGGTNLTYLDDKPLLEPKQLNPRDRITIGDTVLMLVPLCDKNFDWQDLNDE